MNGGLWQCLRHFDTLTDISGPQRAFRDFVVRSSASADPPFPVSGLSVPHFTPYARSCLHRRGSESSGSSRLIATLLSYAEQPRP